MGVSVPNKFKYCGYCGKELAIRNEGVSRRGFDRYNGGPLYIHIWTMRCPDYNISYEITS